MSRPPPGSQRFGGPPPPPTIQRPPERMGVPHGAPPFRGGLDGGRFPPAMRGGPPPNNSMRGGGPPPPQRMPPNNFRGVGPPGRFGAAPHGRLPMGGGGRPPMHMQDGGPHPPMNGSGGPGFARGGPIPGRANPMQGPPMGQDPGNYHGARLPMAPSNFQGRPPFGGPCIDGGRNFRGQPGRGFPGRPPHMQQPPPPILGAPPMFRGPAMDGRGRLGRQGPPAISAGPYSLPPPNNLSLNPQQQAQQYQQHQQLPQINNVQTNPNSSSYMATPARGGTQATLPRAAAVTTPMQAVTAVPTATKGAAVATNSSFSHPSTLQAQPAATPRDWEEYTDAATGNSYYSDGVTSSWTKPAEMIEAERLRQTSQNGQQQQQQQKQQQQQQQREAWDDSRGKKRKAADAISVSFTSKDAALKAFNKLMCGREVSPLQKWMEVVKLFTGKECSKDAKTVAIWEACESALTTGERKQALAEYQTKLAKDLRNKERQGRQRTKEAFLKLLTDVVNAEMVSRGSENRGVESLRYQDVERLLQKDERYHAVESDEMRELLFAEFAEEYRKREERRKQNEFRDAQDSFVAFLKELAEKTILNCTVPDSWNAFVASLRSSSGGGDNDRSLVSNDSRFTTLSSSVLKTEEKDFLFKNFVDGLIRSEEEDRRRSQEERREAAMAQRDFFRETLVQAALNGKIFPSSSYSSAVDSVLSQDASFLKLQQHNRDRPKELFEEFVNDWNELYRRDRLFLSDIVRKRVENSNAQTFKDETKTFDDFCKVLLDEAANQTASDRVQRIIDDESNPVSSALLYFNELKLSSSSRRRNSQLTQHHDSSSEDEGEIAEDEGDV